MIAIKKLRERKGLTQMQMADALGVARGRSAMWETGKSFPRAEMLPAIAKLLGCTLDDLYKGEKEVV